MILVKIYISCIITHRGKTYLSLVGTVLKMGNYTIFWMFENPSTGRQARNFTTEVPKTVDVKSSSEQIFSEN